MSKFLVSAETELFCHRFSNMCPEELENLLRSTFRFVQSLYQTELGPPSVIAEDLYDLYMTLNMIYAPLKSWTKIVRKYMDDCNEEFFQVPFQFALSLVAGRQVYLVNGMARVPYSKLHVILSALFSNLVEKGLQRAKFVSHHSQFLDNRFNNLLMEFKTYLLKMIGIEFTNWQLPVHAVHREELNGLSKYFPPCMQHLHRVLKEKHRLRHHSRIQYTLFLKELGLPIGEALRFWQQEYQQPPCHVHGMGTGCDHSWETDGKRYRYNIRHLYGLEGSRINYRAHSCATLQGRSLGHGEVGGCPFVHFDHQHIQDMMDAQDIETQEQKKIFDLVTKRKYSKACQCHLESKVRTLARKFASEKGKPFDVSTECTKETFSDTCPIQDISPSVIDNVHSHKRDGSDMEMQSSNDRKKMRVGNVPDMTPVKIALSLHEVASKMASPCSHQSIDDAPSSKVAIQEENCCEMQADLRVEENDTSKDCEKIKKLKKNSHNEEVDENSTKKNEFRLLHCRKPIDFFKSYKNLIDNLNVLQNNETISECEGYAV